MNNPENNTEKVSNLSLKEIRERVGNEAERIAELGNWPVWAKSNAEENITYRLPTADNTAPGFDAGVACALNLIPHDKQKLSAGLHVLYTPDSVAQILQESADMKPDSETTWWLAACNVCNEDKPIDADAFKKQLSEFEDLTTDPEARQKAAKEELNHMTTSFETDTYGVPYGEKDGCIQGAYVAGYPFGTMYSDRFGMYEISTFTESIGNFENFPWKNPDKKGADGKMELGTSGNIHGSPQRVKCADKEEFLKALEIVKEKFKNQMPERQKIKDILEG